MLEAGPSVSAVSQACWARFHFPETKVRNGEEVKWFSPFGVVGGEAGELIDSIFEMTVHHHQLRFDEGSKPLIGISGEDFFNQSARARHIS